jgi:hypothetical protein
MSPIADTAKISPGFPQLANSTAAIVVIIMCFISLQISILLFEFSEGLADEAFSVIVNYAADLQEAFLVTHDGKDIRLTLAISYMNFVLVFNFPFLFRKLGVPHLVLSYPVSEQNHLTCLKP